MVDGNQETATVETAYVGVNAFASTADAFAAHSGYSGPVVLNGGTYASVDLTTGAGNVDLLLVGDLEAPGAAEADISIGTLTGGAGDTITLNSEAAGNGDLTVDGGSYGGVISGDGDLTKVTNGTLTLSGTNDYTGETNVDDGTLIITNASGLGAGGGTSGTNVAGGAFLTIDLAGSQTVAEDLTFNANGAGRATMNLDTSGGQVTTLSGALTVNSTGANLVRGPRVAAARFAIPETLPGT